MRCTETSSPWRHTKCRNSCRLLRQLHSEIDSLIVDVSLSTQFVNQTLNHSSQKMMIICWWFETTIDLTSSRRSEPSSARKLSWWFNSANDCRTYDVLLNHQGVSKLLFNSHVSYLDMQKSNPPSHHDSVQAMVLIHSNLILITANAITIFDSYTNNLESKGMQI